MSTLDEIEADINRRVPAVDLKDRWHLRGLVALVREIEALANDLEATQSTPAGFYPEATAHADGYDIASEAAADAIRAAITKYLGGDDEC